MSPECPFCGLPWVGAVCVDPGKEQVAPAAGDFSVCSACGRVAVFQVTGPMVTGLRRPNVDEYADAWEAYRVAARSAFRELLDGSG